MSVHKRLLLLFICLHVLAAASGQHIYKPNFDCYSKKELIGAADSVKTITTEFTRDPDKAVLYGHRAYYRIPLNEYKEALADLDSSIAIDSSYKNAYFTRGLVKLYLGYFAQASPDFRKVIQLDSSDYEACEILGLSYLLQDSLAAAWRYFQKYIYTDADSCNKLLGIMYDYTNQKFYDEALKILNKQLSTACDKELLYAQLGDVYLDKEKYRKGIYYFNMIITHGTDIKTDTEDLAYYYFKRAFCYDNLKKYRRAIKDYSKAIELDSTDTDSYYNRGLIYLDQKRRDLALDDFIAAANLGDKDALSELYEEFPNELSRNPKLLNSKSNIAE
jgi:tetratricopeptide (TPR) repeat protein